MANSVDPDETPHSAASHLGLNCLLRPVCPNTYGRYGNCGYLYFREALASPGVLNMSERVDWKMCSVNKNQEEMLASDFKTLFRTFDFNME